VKAPAYLEENVYPDKASSEKAEKIRSEKSPSEKTPP
jgi:hypothetical protein